MAAKCGVCSLDINESDVIDSLKCENCDYVVHLKCSGFNVNKKSSRRNTFKCYKCKGITPASSISDSEDISGNVSGIYNAINKLKKDFETSLDSKLDSLEMRISKKAEEKFGQIIKDSIHDVVNKIQESINDLKTENSQIKGEFSKMKQDFVDLSTEFNEMKEQINDLQQYSRVNNVEIRGVPVTTNENVYALLEAIARLINVPWNRQEISVAHRLPAFKRGAHPSIVVRFISRTTRASWLLAAKTQQNLNADQLHPPLKSSAIFVNEHLTGVTKLILSRAKQLVRDKRIAFAWVKDGRVLVKTTADGRARRIRRLEDLDEELAARSNRSGGGGAAVNARDK